MVSKHLRIIALNNAIRIWEIRAQGKLNYENCPLCDLQNKILENRNEVLDPESPDCPYCDLYAVTGISCAYDNSLFYRTMEGRKRTKEKKALISTLKWARYLIERDLI